MRRLRVLPGTRHGMRDPIALPVMALGGLAAGAAALALSPATGAAVLAGMAQTDGLTGHLDRVLPSSSFKLLSLWVLLLLALTLGTNPLTRGRPRPSWPMAATALFALWLGLSHLLAVAPGNGADHVRGFWATLLLVPILGLTIRDARDLRLVLVALVVSGVVSALCVIVETLLGQRLTVVANPDAPRIPATLEVSYPGRRGTRTAVRMSISVPTRPCRVATPCSSATTTAGPSPISAR